jgi:DNA-binding transcriptional LysR family regulator
VALVAAGLGVSLLPRQALSTLNLRDVSTVEVFGPALSREIGVFQRKGGEASAAARELLNTLITMYKSS